MPVPKDVIILGKSNTSRECPFDAEEVWGVNNVASHPDFCGAIASVKIENPGSGYTRASITVEGTGKDTALIPVIKDGQIVEVQARSAGQGFTSPPVLKVEGDGSGAILAATVHPIRKIHRLFAFDLLDKGYTDGMKQFAPICSWQDYKDIDYPLANVIESFDTRYFTNTVSYMVALAAFLKIPRVRIYGVDVTFGAAYAQENRGVEYWIARAQERGCKIEVPESSHLLRTVSGAMYGVPDHCNVMLYLHERINLINVLPRQGSYSDALKAHNAWWVLFPKTDEAQAHNVQVQQQPNGSLTFNCPQEYLTDCHMPPESWEFIRRVLKDLDAKEQLPFSVISAYEKLVLSKPDGGN